MPSFQTIQDLSPDDRTLVESILAKNASDRSRNEVNILAARASVINNRVVLNNPDNYIAIASGDTIPNGMSGFAKEALFIESDAANGAVRLYANSGDESQANFKPIGLPTNGLTLVNNSDDNTLSINQNGNTGTNVATDGAIHIENTGNAGIGLGVYTNAGAEATSALAIFKAENAAFDQNVVSIVNDGTANNLYLESNTALGTGKAMLFLQSNVAQTTNIALAFIRQDHASSTTNVLYVQNDGAGRTFLLDDNGTGTVATIDIDKDGNNAARIFGMSITVDNAGVGGLVGGIDFSGMSDTEPLFKLTSTDTDLSSKNPESDAEAGWFPVLVGTTTYAVPIYALS